MPRQPFQAHRRRRARGRGRHRPRWKPAFKRVVVAQLVRNSRKHMVGAGIGKSE